MIGKVCVCNNYQVTIEIFLHDWHNVIQSSFNLPPLPPPPFYRLQLEEEEKRAAGLQAKLAESQEAFNRLSEQIRGLERDLQVSYW